MLELKNIYAGYKQYRDKAKKMHYHWIVENISFTINTGETVGIIGQNGAGKSTLAKSIIGQTMFRKGDIIHNEKLLSKLKTWQCIENGIVFFPQGGSVFPNLTVSENLRYAGLQLSSKAYKQKLEEIHTYTPGISKQKKQIKAGALSGGEKHLLSLQMVMLREPDLLILDEPSAGLAPKAADEMYESLARIKSNAKLSMLVIEQNVDKVLKFADRIVMIKNKQIALEKASTDISLKVINKYYFGNN